MLDPVSYVSVTQVCMIHTYMHMFEMLNLNLTDSRVHYSFVVLPMINFRAHE